MIGLLMCVLGIARQGRAEAQGDDEAQGAKDDTPPRHVEVKIVAQAEDPPLQTAISELLERLQVTMHFASVTSIDNEEMWTPHEGAPAAVARVWIDLRDRTQVTLYLTGDRQDRVLVRQVPLVLHLDEVAREEIAHIVEATVDELLLGGQIGIEKKHAAVPKVELPPPLPEPQAGLDVGFGYAAQAWGPRAPLHGPAAFLGLVKKTGLWRPGLWLSAELRFPETVDRDIDQNSVTARLDQGAIRLLAIADRALSSRWLLRAGVGGGVDWVRISPAITAKPGDTGTPATSRFELIPMVRAVATARYAFTSKSELFFGIGADVDLIDTQYVVTYAANTATVYHPWQVRPMAFLGLASDVLAY